jgi:hypothetical protein
VEKKGKEQLSGRTGTRGTTGAATTTADDADDEWVAAGGSEVESKSTVLWKKNSTACMFVCVPGQ